MGGLYAQLSLAPDLLPAATALIGIAQVGGICVGLVASSSIFINLAADGITTESPGRPPADVINAISGVGSTRFGRLPPDDRGAVLQQIVHAISRVYYPAVVAGAVGIIFSCIMNRTN